MIRSSKTRRGALMLLCPLLMLLSCTASPTAAPAPTPAVSVPVATSVPAAASIPAATSIPQAASATPAPSVAAAQATVPASTALSVPGTPTTPSGQATEQPTVIIGSGDFVFPDPTVGLAALPSYRATLTISFDGTRDGKPEKWSGTYVMLFSKSPAFRQLTLTKTGNVPDPGPVYQAEREGVSYEVGDDNACTATELQAGYSLGDQSEPASFVTGVIGADAAGGATVNGVETNHYTFDERALGQPTTKSTGELWVAANGGYMLKYLLASQGKQDYFGKGVEGTLTLDYELTDIGKPAALQLPADCPPGMVNVPTLPDASNIHQAPGTLSFETHSKQAAIITFYQKQLPGLGWKVLAAPIVTDASAALDYAQGNQELSIYVLTDKNITTVDIVLLNAKQ